MARFLLLLLGLLVVRASSIQPEHQNRIAAARELVSDGHLHTFFYLWYGNPTHDRSFFHWDHYVLPHWTEVVNSRYKDRIEKRHNPDQSHLHSPFYPFRGPYSSRDPEVIKAQLEELRDHGVDVVSLSWWGQPGRKESADSQGVNTDDVVSLVLREADALNGGMKVVMHMEPYPGRTVESMREDLEYIKARYASSASFFPLFYVYDSYHISSEQWARLLTLEGDLSVRGTELDGIFVGLFLEGHHGEDLKRGGFDGFYTYFASSGFSYGSTPSRWASMVESARSKGMLSILSVGPGYNDKKIRPWNEQNTRDREDGLYLDRMFAAALRANPDAISLTSYNEWGEGTQMEPAIRAACSATWPGNTTHLSIEPYQYESYTDDDPYFYLKRAEAWGSKFKALRSGGRGSNGEDAQDAPWFGEEGLEDGHWKGRGKASVLDDEEDVMVVGEDEPEGGPLPEISGLMEDAVQGLEEL